MKVNATQNTQNGYALSQVKANPLPSDVAILRSKENFLAAKKSSDTALKQPQSLLGGLKTPSMGGLDELAQLQAQAKLPQKGGDVHAQLQAWAKKFEGTGDAVAAMTGLSEIFKNSGSETEDFFADLMRDGLVDHVMKYGSDMAKQYARTVDVLGKVDNFLEATKYLDKAINGDPEKHTEAAYNAMQVIFTVGSEYAPEPLNHAFEFTSELFKVREGEGVVADLYAKPMSQLEGHKLATGADIAYTEDMFGAVDGERQHYGANLSLVKSGLSSPSEVLSEIRALQSDFWSRYVDRSDYAVTQAPDGSYAIHELSTPGLFADDMDNRTILERAVIHNNNAHNIVALVADNGDYATVSKADNGWDVAFKGHVLP